MRLVLVLNRLFSRVKDTGRIKLLDTPTELQILQHW